MLKRQLIFRPSWARWATSRFSLVDYEQNVNKCDNTEIGIWINTAKEGIFGRKPHDYV